MCRELGGVGRIAIHVKTAGAAYRGLQQVAVRGRGPSSLSQTFRRKIWSPIR